MEKKTSKKWIFPRHRIVRNILHAVLKPYCKLKYHIDAEPFRAQGDRAYLILMNHQTPFDQFFVGISFQGPVYYMATEDIFSNGLVSRLIRWLVNPIPIKKQTTDVGAVMNAIRVAREGGTIAIAPEGNRTYSGKTEYMNPAIAGLSKKLKLPIALYRIEGGYGAQPRWSDCVRKGPMRSYVSRVIEPEEYASMTTEELYSIIQKELYVNEGCLDNTYTSRKKAEYLERAIYVCPYCGLSSFESHGNEIACNSCGKTVLYGDDKQLRGKDFDFPFQFVSQWYDYQQSFVNSLDLNAYCEAPMYEDRAKLSEVIVYHKKVPLRKDVSIRLYGNRIIIDEGQQNQLTFLFPETMAVSVLGRNKLNIYHKDTVYQLKGGKRFNALKYVNIFYRYKNISKGDINGKFLGL